jgi:sugar/nucleoside kinase (ribokinase family)
MGKITIAGTGCCLLDYLYTGINFKSPEFTRYLSRKTGDGGLNPGKLVLTDDLEKFSGKKFTDLLNEIIGDREPDELNLGGPSIVALIHAAQLLANRASVHFYGTIGKDPAGEKIISIIKRTPVRTNKIKIINHPSSTTNVLSDHSYYNGQGERTFIHNIGTSWDIHPEQLDRHFFSSDITVFGGTALVPNIHSNLGALVRKVKQHQSITVVNTVFDFRSEKSNPGARWQFLDNDESFRDIDILIMDLEEALKISGTDSPDNASAFYIDHGVSSFVITDGASPVWFFSDGRLFRKHSLSQLPTSDNVHSELKHNTGLAGDTTGCGDNLAGGIIASVAWQLQNMKPGELDIIDACAWGIASGGFTCFYIGGTYLEWSKGEKFNLVNPYYELYLKQIEDLI